MQLQLVFIEDDADHDFLGWAPTDVSFFMDDKESQVANMLASVE